MKKLIIAACIAGGAVAAVPAVAGAEGNAYGKNARECLAALDLSLGQGIQAGRAAHPGVKMTPAAIAASVHCAG